MREEEQWLRRGRGWNSQITLFDKEDYLYDIELCCCQKSREDEEQQQEEGPEDDPTNDDDESFNSQPHPDEQTHLLNSISTTAASNMNSPSFWLPDEMLMEIFSFLSPIPHCVRLRRLNCRWKAYFEKVLKLQKTFPIVNPQWIDINTLCMEQISQTMKLFPNIENVIVCNINGIEDCRLFELFANHFQKLRTIKFCYCNFMNCLWVNIPSLERCDFVNSIGERTILGKGAQEDCGTIFSSQFLNPLSYDRHHSIIYSD
jgi:hypothetical protein